MARQDIPLLVLGDFAWDVLIRTPTKLLPGGDTLGELRLEPGGSAANVTVWAARCGLETVFLGKIGKDRFGLLAKENLAEEGVGAHFVETSEHRTAVVAVWVDENGKRSMVSGKGADFYLQPSELPTDLLRAARHLHLTAWSFFTDPPQSAARKAARIAKEAGATLSFDPGSFQMIHQMGAKEFLQHVTDLGVDIFFPNLEEGEALTGGRTPEEIAGELARLFPKALIALKLDAQGALIVEDGKRSHIPPGPDNPIDATGAGDAFAGAYLAEFLRNRDHLKAARFAVMISSWVVGHAGARPKPDARLRRLLARG